MYIETEKKNQKNQKKKTSYNSYNEDPRCSQVYKSNKHVVHHPYIVSKAKPECITNTIKLVEDNTSEKRNIFCKISLVLSFQ